MSETNQDVNNQPPEASSAVEATDRSAAGGESTAVKSRPTLRLAWITVAIAVVFTAVAQYFAPQFDHQNANLIGLTCVSIATLYFLFCWHRLDRWKGNPWRVPVGILAGIILFFVAFRFEGFSGEMLPLFRFRLTNENQHELKSVATTDDQVTPLVEVISPPDADQTLSPQFLGPSRNGVYRKRWFSIPQSPTDLKVLWDQGIGDGWSSFAVKAGQAITLEQRGEQECLSCYRLLDGELIWIQKHAGLHQNPLGGVGPRSTPTIAGDKVYATTATGFLWCVDRSTGDVIWSSDLLALAGWDQSTFETAAPWGYAGSPLLVDGLCVLPLGGPVGGPASASLVALDAESGEVIWKSGEDQLSYASPILTTLSGQRQIVSVNEKTVSGHLVADGKLLWSFGWPGSTNTGANCSSAVTVGDNGVLVGKGYGGGSALVQIAKVDAEWTATDVWRSNRVLKTKFNHTCVDGQVGYAISNGSLQAVNLDDATTYWIQPRRNRAGQGQVVLVQDVLVLQDETGDVVFVAATVDDYNELARVPALDSKTWNVPTVAGRYLLVRNDRQVICFELPAL